MTGKGLAYPRTQWSYGERPVRASKLNAWDDHIADAVELLCRLINQALGGGDGVAPGIGDELRVVATSPPTLSVRALRGCAFINEMPFQLTEATETLAIDAPQNNPRVDLVQARLEDWTIMVKEGVEAATPETPTPDEECLALAGLLLRPGMAAVKDVDDGVNGFIVDARRLLGA